MRPRILVTLLLICYAQKGEAQRQFLEEKEIPGRSQINIPLPGSDRLIIAFSNWVELEMHSNIDSLLYLFIRDFDSVNDSLKAKKIVYVIDYDNIRRLYVDKFESKQIAYRFQASGEMIDDEPDTLIIEKRYPSSNKHGLPDNIRLYFILRDWHKMVSLSGTLNTYLQKARSLAVSHPRKNLFKPRYNTYVNLDSAARYPVLAADYWELGKIFQPSIGIGTAGKNFSTILMADVGLVPGLSRTGLRLGWHEYFFFETQQDRPFRIIRNSFLSTGILFFKPRDYTRRPTAASRSSITLGFLINRQGTYFEKNTWRLSGTLSLLPRLRVEPEIYWNGLFKRLYPGIRLAVGL